MHVATGIAAENSLAHGRAGTFPLAHHPHPVFCSAVRDEGKLMAQATTELSRATGVGDNPSVEVEKRGVQFVSFDIGHGRYHIGNLPTYVDAVPGSAGAA